MILPLQNFATLLENMSAGLQGGSAQLVDLSVGSVLRALLEACASVALWMQWLIIQVLGMTRASTSSGSDLDSWMADFSLVRLSGVPSDGEVTFSRYTPGQAAQIAVGALVKTLDGSQSFTVSPNAANPGWNGLDGYTIPQGALALTVPVQALLPGTAGNVLAGAVGLLATAIPGVDSVTNSIGFTRGVDAESDAALRGRFQLYINSRSLGTTGAIAFSIQTLQQGLRYTIQENVDQQGHWLPGHFCVVVDDGTGFASSALIAEVSAAVDRVRPIGSTFSVSGPTAIPVSVVMSLTLVPGSTSASIASNIQSGITLWVSELAMGATLAASKLESIAHQTDAAVVSVTSLQINGSPSDVVAPVGAVIQLVSVSVMAN